MRHRIALSLICSVAVLLGSVPPVIHAEESLLSKSLLAMQSRLEARVKTAPNDGRSWRLLGRVYLKTHHEQEAFWAFERAVAIDPENAAANYDFGRVLFIAGRFEAAAPYLENALKLAPESEYAAPSRDYLTQLYAQAEESGIELAGYEVKRFDGSDLSERIDDNLLEKAQEKRDFDFRLEAGLLYNSNVALTPISRELASGTRASFQAFIAPEIEYRWFSLGQWTAGPAFSSYFNVNENNFSEFNLQNYQPAFFLERTVEFEKYTLLPRVQYDFTHDEFEGKTFGNRHALTTSASAFWDNGETSFLYWSINYTDFAEDGLFPEIDSRDGWSNSLGLSHAVPTDWRYVDQVRAGVDVESADTDGSDFRFHGVYLYGESQTDIRDDLTFKLQLGWGYRDYPDFDLSPSRNENIWRIGGELRKYFTDRCSVALVFNYDRFDSANSLFEADRYVSGIVTQYEY